MQLQELWDVNHCKIKVGKKFIQREKLCWFLINTWQMWQVKCDKWYKKLGTRKKSDNYNPAHKTVEKFGNSWVLLIYLSWLNSTWISAIK